MQRDYLLSCTNKRQATFDPSCKELNDSSFKNILTIAKTVVLLQP